MLTEYQISEIRELLRQGAEVDILCFGEIRQMELFGLTYGFGGKRRVINAEREKLNEK